MAEFSFVFDMDGVLFLHKAGGYELINGAKAVMETIVENEIPFTFMTNGTGTTEEERAKAISDIIGIEFSADQVIMPTTAMKLEVPKFKKSRVLFVARDHDNALKLAKNMGLENITTLQEFVEHHTELWPIMKPKEEQRDLEKEEPFEAVFVVQGPSDWGVGIQVINDVVRSNGRLGHEHLVDEQQIPVFFGNPDFWYGASHSVPRFTLGCFRECVAHIYETITGKKMEVKLCGKPYAPMYECAKKILEDRAKRFYMVGDNPKSDIKGANAFGWPSILVRTGIHKSTENDKENPATHFCNDVVGAFEYVCGKEERDDLIQIMRCKLAEYAYMHQ
eukprot:TRINITY_DN54065_c0_g1_i1.p1 TRINITY_DN54065_c0_g1~~TRINITY_DN54065_c0_g1_i1.p1  ORF type:complete len:334 (-),score=83.21 TRINITY_DN54065_c0_g1_i1:203-1204(-)